MKKNIFKSKIIENLEDQRRLQQLLLLFLPIQQSSLITLKSTIFYKKFDQMAVSD
jgi:hypothetical protein